MPQRTEQHSLSGAHGRARSVVLVAISPGEATSVVDKFAQTDTSFPHISASKKDSEVGEWTHGWQFHASVARDTLFCNQRAFATVVHRPPSFAGIATRSLCFAPLQLSAHMSGDHLFGLRSCARCSWSVCTCPSRFCKCGELLDVLSLLTGRGLVRGCRQGQAIHEAEQDKRRRCPELLTGTTCLGGRTVEPHVLEEFGLVVLRRSTRLLFFQRWDGFVGLLHPVGVVASLLGKPLGTCACVNTGRRYRFGPPSIAGEGATPGFSVPGKKTTGHFCDVLCQKVS